MAAVQRVLKIFNKEFRSFFVSPVAYIVIAIFLVFTGIFFFVLFNFFLNNQATLRNFFSMLPWILAIFVPMLTMRLFSEEFNVGSYEVLTTLPVSLVDIVVGKFLAVWAFVGIMLLPTLVYAIIIMFIGGLDIGPLFGGYFGAMLLAAAYAGIGLFASSLTRNQIIALIAGFAACIALFLLDKGLVFLPPMVVNIVQTLGSDYHFQTIAKGILDLRDILYFLTIAFLGLYGTYLVTQEKK
jgi:ABC-2 type transport system permease protein